MHLLQVSSVHTCTVTHIDSFSEQKILGDDLFHWTITFIFILQDPLTTFWKRPPHKLLKMTRILPMCWFCQFRCQHVKMLAEWCLVICIFWNTWIRVLVFAGKLNRFSSSTIIWYLLGSISVNILTTIIEVPLPGVLQVQMHVDGKT